MNPKTIRIGVTGGIGSGKSIVCRILESMKIPVYYADDRAKWLMNHDSEVKKEIVSIFGAESYQESGLNRPFIAGQIFKNQALLHKMNKLVHPAVAADFDHWTRQQNSKIIAKEAALLFETGSYQALDQTWLVSCPEDIRIKRILKRDPHRSEDEIRSIIAKQWPEEKKIALCDFEIVNDGRKMVIPQVINGLNELLA